MDVASLAQAKAMGVIGSILVLLSPIVSLVVLIPPLMFFADVILGIGIKAYPRSRRGVGMAN